MPSYESPELEKIKQLPVNEAAAAIGAYNQKYNAELRKTEAQGPKLFEQELLEAEPGQL